MAAAASAVLLTLGAFTPSLLPLPALVAGLGLAVCAAAGWGVVSRGLLLVWAAVAAIFAASCAFAGSNVTAETGVLMAAACVGALTRRFLWTWITLADAVLGGALGVCTGWIAGVVYSSVFASADHTLDLVALLWTPMVLLFVGVLPLVILVASDRLLSLWPRRRDAVA